MPLGRLQRRGRLARAIISVILVLLFGVSPAFAPYHSYQGYGFADRALQPVSDVKMAGPVHDDVELSGGVSEVALQASQAVSSRGMIAYGDSLRVFRAHGIDQLTQEQRESAGWLTAHLDMYRTWYYQGTLIPQIHQIRGDFVALLYRNIESVYDYADEWQTFINNGWMLKDAQGNYVRSPTWPEIYLIDIGNPSVQQWVAAWCKTVLDQYGFNGVFADNGLSSGLETWWDVTAMPINPRTGQLWTDAEARQALIQFHKAIKNAIGTKLLVCNGIFSGSRFYERQAAYMEILTNSPLDGFMVEGIFSWVTSDWKAIRFYSEAEWKASVDFTVWVQDNWLTTSTRLFCPLGYTFSQDSAAFVFSSLLLGISKSQNWLQVDQLDLDSVQNLFKTDLGTPVATYYLVPGTHVYARDFTKVKVLVNPTDTSYTVTLGTSYRTLDGQTVTSVNVGPRTGLILTVP